MTAHNLANLYDESDQKVLTRVIVIVDRRVLDKAASPNGDAFEKQRDEVKGAATSAELKGAARQKPSYRFDRSRKFPRLLILWSIYMAKNLPIADEAHSRT